MNLNLSRLCQKSLAAEIGRLKAERWYEDNKAAIDAYHAHVRARGLALEKQRVW
jgi:antitoxin CcdA